MNRQQSNHMHLKLYVLDDRATREAAVERINAVLGELLGDRYRIEVIDLEEHPEAAEEAQILAIPTLVKEQPEPAVRLVGDLSNTDTIKRHLAS